MNFQIAQYIGTVYFLSELGLQIFRRASRVRAQGTDAGSSRLLWWVVGPSVGIAWWLALAWPAARFEHVGSAVTTGVGLFIAGLILRWYSIFYLGRFFTVNVAIASDHRLIDTGPYRHIRHPSYTGALLEFLGLGLCLCNWASVVVLMTGTLLAFGYRIHVEEAALAQGLGEDYRSYMRRTKRLLPAVY
jgi:protein-S-isoprenylcysteine O-methyltransferase